MFEPFCDIKVLFAFYYDVFRRWWHLFLLLFDVYHLLHMEHLLSLYFLKKCHPTVSASIVFFFIVSFHIYERGNLWHLHQAICFYYDGLCCVFRNLTSQFSFFDSSQTYFPYNVCEERTTFVFVSQSPLQKEWEIGSSLKTDFSHYNHYRSKPNGYTLGYGNEKWLIKLEFSRSWLMKAELFNFISFFIISPISPIFWGS